MKNHSQRSQFSHSFAILLAIQVVALVAACRSSIAQRDNKIVKEVTRYRCTPLGDTKGQKINLTSVNEHGTLVGSSYSIGASDISVAYYWNGHISKRLPSLEADGGGAAFDINKSGRIVGVVFPSHMKNILRIFPVVWINHQLHVLRLPPSGIFGSAFAISSNGLIVGSTGTKSHSEFAVEWEQNGPILLHSPQGYDHAIAHGVNEAGAVVGVCWIVSQKSVEYHAVKWSGLSPSLLPGLEHQPYSNAYSINKFGDVAGLASSGRSFEATEGNGSAVLWHNGQVKYLGSLGGNYSKANCINDTGQVVGVSTTRLTKASSEERHAFVWQNGRMFDLNLMLVGRNKGVILEEANHISNNSFITVSGRDNGKPRSYLLTPIH